MLARRQLWLMFFSAALLAFASDDKSEAGDHSKSHHHRHSHRRSRRKSNTISRSNSDQTGSTGSISRSRRRHGDHDHDGEDSDNGSSHATRRCRHDTNRFWTRIDCIAPN